MTTIQDQRRKLEKSLQVYREYKVVKANDLIQKSRFYLTTQEQKIILYLITKIKPKDINLKEHIFKIQDFCELCGLDKTSGGNYEYIKKTLKDLRDKSIWITTETDDEITLSWLDYVKLNKDSGAVTIKISELIKPYLLLLQENFTQYEVLYILAMKSQYSIRLYELLKSYAFQKKHLFEINELKKTLSAEAYNLFGNFKQKVLDISLREINELSDISVSYEIIKEGRKFTKIEFFIKTKKDMRERLETWKNIENIIDPPQMSMFHEKLKIEDIINKI